MNGDEQSQNRIVKFICCLVNFTPSSSTIKKNNNSTMCLTKDEIVSKLDNALSTVTLKIVEPHKTLDLETSIRQTVKDFVNLLITQYKYSEELFKSILLSSTETLFKDKIINLTINTDKTLEELGINNTKPNIIYTLKLNYINNEIIKENGHNENNELKINQNGINHHTNNDILKNGITNHKYNKFENNIIEENNIRAIGTKRLDKIIENSISKEIIENEIQVDNNETIVINNHSITNNINSLKEINNKVNGLIDQEIKTNKITQSLQKISQNLNENKSVIKKIIKKTNNNLLDVKKKVIKVDDDFVENRENIVKSNKIAKTASETKIENSRSENKIANTSSETKIANSISENKIANTASVTQIGSSVDEIKLDNSNSEIKKKKIIKKVISSNKLDKINNDDNVVADNVTNINKVIENGTYDENEEYIEPIKVKKIIKIRKSIKNNNQIGTENKIGSEIKIENSNSEINSENNNIANITSDTKIDNSTSETKIDNSSSETKIDNSSSETKIDNSSSETKIDNSSSEIKLRNCCSETKIENITDVNTKKLNNIIKSDSETKVKTKIIKTKLKSAADSSNSEIKNDSLTSINKNGEATVKRVKKIVVRKVKTETTDSNSKLKTETTDDNSKLKTETTDVSSKLTQNTSPSIINTENTYKNNLSTKTEGINIIKENITDETLIKSDKVQNKLESNITDNKIESTNNKINIENETTVNHIIESKDEIKMNKEELCKENSIEQLDFVDKISNELNQPNEEINKTENIQIETITIDDNNSNEIIKKDNKSKNNKIDGIKTVENIISEEQVKEININLENQPNEIKNINMSLDITEDTNMSVDTSKKTNVVLDTPINTNIFVDIPEDTNMSVDNSKDTDIILLAGDTIQNNDNTKDNENQLYPAVDPINFVGLVNQAMTCYLNSLIQALFMTPEFRNAVYKWKYEGYISGEDKSITYQLQKLFVNLQTSTRAAVETTDLTKSFGWESSDAWQQHDIQELCRVMFEALETQFRESKSIDCDQGNLINSLYQGKMMDYVKCLECSTEKSREDTFLDIPLPVRPFGSTIAYGDIVEALRAFVQPETLDGNNQYHCEKCNKKCDAHKGLKFTEFPYLLTLHLMRFDFDYNTMHRIKLNDKVTFPKILNLNSFNASKSCVIFDKDKEEESEGFPEEIPTKCDDSSTTDSGSALDDESCQDHDQDVDEGIDISNPEQKDNTSNAKGPYMYELFSIMIHSGSASGGHYYAYIKDFTTDQWYCFNDQSVTRITDDDISKTYGGGSTRYYSGAYSSSTNAYMLMYRQINKDRNTIAITREQFPLHIRELYSKLQEREEEEKVKSQRQADMIRIQVHTKKSPEAVETSSEKIFVSPDTTVHEVLDLAFSRLDMKDITSLDQCRLIKVNRSLDTHEPIEGKDEESIGSILADCISKYRIKSISHEMILEYKKPNESFKTYVPGSTKVNMFLIDVDTGNVQGPTILKTNIKSTVADLKTDILKEHNMSLDIPVHVVLENQRITPKYLTDDSSLLKFEFDYHKMDYFYGTTAPPRKIFVSFNKIDSEPDTEFEHSAMYKIIERISNTIRLTVQLPDVDPDTLSKYKITQLKKYTHSTDTVTVPTEEVSPANILPHLLSNDINQSDQSTSEDSSLTDSERTLMGDDPEDNRDDFVPSDNNIQDLDLDASSSSLSTTITTSTNATSKDVPSILLSSASTNYSYRHRFDDDDDDDEEETYEQREMERALRNTRYKYFKVLDANFNANITIDRPQLMIEIDKRTTVAQLMKDLEPYVRVPSLNFCIYTVDQPEIEQKVTCTLENSTDGEVITIKLKRVLQDGECQAKIYKLIEDKDPQFLIELIFSKGQTIGELKKELIEELNKKSSNDLQVERCRLREKNYKSACKILLNNLIIGREVLVFNQHEWFLQEIDYPEIKTDDNQTVLCTRRYHPDTDAIDKVIEIVLEEITLDNIKTEISKISEIPIEFLDTTLFKESSYTRSTNIVPALVKHVWNMDPPDYLSDGKLIVYCDNRTEKKAPSTTDESKSDKSTTIPYITRKKEKALKIVTSRDSPALSPQPE